MLAREPNRGKFLAADPRYDIFQRTGSSVRIWQAGTLLYAELPQLILP